jgi:hypothetical protein
MRDGYKIKGATTKLEIEVEKETAELILEMEKFTQIPRSELANTALKRFISSHKDFLPQPSHADKK